MAPLQATNKQFEDAVDEETPIQKFYNDKTIFLTGATGFFGKIIMEKLLRVTKIKHIYILIRNKKGKDAYTRMEEIFDDPIFEVIKRLNPKFRHTFTAVSGDCSLPLLGISSDQRDILIENVDIVIHAAATVRFDEKLKMALAINVNGTKEILALCKDIKNLSAVVHVSTAFANCNHKHIEEKYYKMKLTAENVCRLNDCLDEKTLENITPELISDYPNTYTFTKALAEDLVRNQGKGLPIVIFRPGIVIPTYKEPISGWIDNMYGPCGIIIAVGAGILRVYQGRMSTDAHIVPVDMSINALLASAWDVAKTVYDEPPIYNYIPDPENPIKWKTYLEIGLEVGERMPIKRSIWYHTLTITPSKLMFQILSFLYHTVPAFTMDIVLSMLGKKPRMMQIYKKVHKFCDIMTYFSNTSWSFSNDNTKELWSKLSTADQKLFFFDMRKIDWRFLVESNLAGIRKYVMKEDPSSIPDAIKRCKRLKILHYTILYSIYTSGILFMYYIISKIFFTF